MDFLKNMRDKLEELEEFSREAEQMMQNAPEHGLFSPRGKKKKRAEREPAPPQEVPRSRRPVDSDVCPVEEKMGRRSSQGEGPKQRLSILDSLGDRLDEAFILQEVLGPPRCEREWG